MPIIPDLRTGNLLALKKGNQLKMAKDKKISVQVVDIILYENKNEDFISLTDIARHKNADHTDDIVKNWMRNRTQWNFQVFGRLCTIRILNPLNSTDLKNRQDSIVL